MSLLKKIFGRLLESRKPFGESCKNEKRRAAFNQLSTDEARARRDYVLHMCEFKKIYVLIATLTLWGA